MNKFCTNLCIIIALFVFIFGFITIDNTYYNTNSTISVANANNFFDRTPRQRGTSEAKVYKVTQNKIIDGDSFQLHRGSKQVSVRLACVDTPELQQAYGLEVKYFLEDTFASYDNDVTYQDLGKDSFGRTIALVFLPSGESINTFLVRNGWAYPYEQYKDNCPIWSEIKSAEHIAVKHDLNLQGINTLRPWVYRAMRKAGTLDDTL